MRKSFYPLILAALILAACSSGPAAQTAPTKAVHPTPNAEELKVTNSTDTIVVTAGNEFTITLRTNLSSGYHWEVAKEIDPGIVQYVWKDYVPDQPGNPNSSGRDVWRFKAMAPGTTTITLGYYFGQTDNAATMPVFNIVVK